MCPILHLVWYIYGVRTIQPPVNLMLIWNTVDTPINLIVWCNNTLRLHNTQTRIVTSYYVEKRFFKSKVIIIRKFSETSRKLKNKIVVTQLYITCFRIPKIVVTQLYILCYRFQNSQLHLKIVVTFSKNYFEILCYMFQNSQNRCYATLCYMFQNS